MYSPDAAAGLLLDAHLDNQVLDELPEQVRPRTLAEGYDVQDRLVASLGQGVVGWKLGAGSPRARRETGIGRPISGRILSDRVFGIGQPVALPALGPVTVEFEIAYVLGRDVTPEDRIEDPLSVVAETRAAFELVRSRFRDRRLVGWPSFAADNAAFEAFILGERLALAAQAGLAETLSVKVNGEERARAATNDDEIGPVAALSDFLDLARERGMTLPIGSVISTGSQSSPFALDRSATMEASYSGGNLSFVLQLSHQ